MQLIPAPSPEIEGSYVDDQNEGGNIRAVVDHLVKCIIDTEHGQRCNQIRQTWFSDHVHEYIIEDEQMAILGVFIGRKAFNNIRPTTLK